ncbi:hypothetical protein M231_05304 [Tremella mesenterica]|uniref:Uncharacterized protein n=1 Tax=Tremella mesenterica TaxID=5217 RepID=A0A4Q1BIE5_TREME|nr:hypothetical protein M231_05304 [Tremella mesenterica]
MPPTLQMDMENPQMTIDLPATGSLRFHRGDGTHSAEHPDLIESDTFKAIGVWVDAYGFHICSFQRPKSDQDSATKVQELHTLIVHVSPFGRGTIQPPPESQPDSEAQPRSEAQSGSDALPVSEVEVSSVEGNNTLGFTLMSNNSNLAPDSVTLNGDSQVEAPTIWASSDPTAVSQSRSASAMSQQSLVEDILHMRILNLPTDSSLDNQPSDGSPLSAEVHNEQGIVSKVPESSTSSSQYEETHETAEQDIESLIARQEWQELSTIWCNMVNSGIPFVTSISEGTRAYLVPEPQRGEWILGVPRVMIRLQDTWSNYLAPDQPLQGGDNEQERPSENNVGRDNEVTNPPPGGSDGRWGFGGRLRGFRQRRGNGGVIEVQSLTVEEAGQSGGDWVIDD